MRLQNLVLLATTFLACINATSAGTKLTAARIPAQGRLLSANQRFLRIDEDEERGFEKAAGLIKATTSKVDGLVDAAKLKTYKLQLNQLQLGDDLVAILKSPKVEKFSTFNRNRDPANQVSLIGKLSAKFGDDVVARTKALGVLEDYIKKVNAAKGGDESLLKTLTTFYGGESRLVTVIVKAKYHPRSVEKAKAVEKQLVGKWKSDKLSSMTVWNRLKFGDDVDEVLSSGKVRIFAKYVSSRGSVLKQLNAKYGEENVAAALATAQGNRATQDIASALQQKQLSGWLSKEESLGKVFELLKFHEIDGLPQKLDTLDEYLKLFKTKNPQDGTTVFMVLRKGFGKDEDQLALMLINALRTPGSSPMVSTISRYQKLLFKEWMARDLDPMSVAVNVFKIPEANVGAANYNDEIKWIIKQYSPFFKRETGLGMGPQVVRSGRV